MLDASRDGDGDDDGRRPIETVYDQYWSHVRHVEDEMWSFTRIWAVVVTAIFTVIGADLPAAAKLGAAFFGALLSVLGFFVVYALRVPFFDFFLTTELIAKEEFGLAERYRRLGDDSDYRINKGVDLPDILIAVYATVAGVMVFSAGIVVDRVMLGVAGAVGTVGLLVVVYVTYIIPQFEAAIDRVATELRDE